MRLIWLLVLSWTLPAQAGLRPKLQNWFPKYEGHWIEAAASCQQELHNYIHSNETFECPAPCACAADCLLQNAPATMQSNLTSAQVLLGLLPTVLLFFGPTITEVAALSTYKPLLAVLLAFASPAIHLGKSFAHIDIREPFLRPRSRISVLWTSWLSRQNVLLQTLFQGLSYIGALAALASNVHNSLHTDLRTVSGWRCGVVLMPLYWSILAVVPHIWGMIAVRVRLQGSRSFQPSIQSALRSTIFLREGSMGEDSILSEMLFWMASLCAIVHHVFGILDLSSLLFISVLEALQVFVMYAVSAFLCQFILRLELANMRDELSRNPIQQDAGRGTRQISKVDIPRPSTA